MMIRHQIPETVCMEGGISDVTGGCVDKLDSATMDSLFF